MSVLKNLESKIAGLVEGTFSRAFRSEVRPVEIARKLAREMEENRTVSVSRTYAPNEYSVFLSPQDRERIADYDSALTSELEGYLLEHSRREKLALLSRPRVEFQTDDRLALGTFGIQARLVKEPDDPAAEPSQGEAGHTMIYSPQRPPEPLEEHVPGHLKRAAVLAEGKRFVVGSEGAVVGRSRDCDIVLEDANVSRRHAEFRPGDEGWTIKDLGSTNGVVVEGRQVRESALRGGERIELGTSEIRFELE
jgi:FHA domain-containing protein